MPNLGVGLLSALLGKLKLGTTYSNTGKGICISAPLALARADSSISTSFSVCAKEWNVVMELVDKLTGRTYSCGEYVPDLEFDISAELG
jgi:hypothetical protein